MKSLSKHLTETLATTVNESDILGNRFTIMPHEWRTFVKIAKATNRSLRTVTDSGLDILLSIKTKQAVAKWDEETLELWTDMSKSDFQAIISGRAKQSGRWLQDPVTEAVTEGIGQGDTVTVKMGKWSGQSGTVTLILKDSYMLDLQDGNSVEVKNSEI